MTERADQDVHGIATDPEAFEAFYRQHLPAVRLYLARRIDDPAVVADLTADIFYQAIRSAGRYCGDLGPPRAWLIGISRNVVAAHRRLRARESDAMTRLQGRRLLDDDAAERIVERMAAEADARALLRSIAELPVRLRAVVELIAVDNLTVGEAAATLGITPGTTRVRYHRARNRLRSVSALQAHEVTP